MGPLWPPPGSLGLCGLLLPLGGLLPPSVAAFRLAVFPSEPGQLETAALDWRESPWPLPVWVAGGTDCGEEVVPKLTSWESPD